MGTKTFDGVVAEILLDENKEIIWIKRYFMSGIHKKGDTFIENRITYEVLESSFTEGKLGGALVEHVVRRLN